MQTPKIKTPSQNLSLDTPLVLNNSSNQLYPLVSVENKSNVGVGEGL